MKKDKKIKVIVIDDIPLVIDGVELALSKEVDIELIDSARSSREAISLILSLKQDIDVAIVDLNLKEKNEARPFELCKEILQRFPKIKVLAFTIYDGKKLISNLKKMGAKGYLSKNFKQDELIHAIRTIAEGKTYFLESENKDSGIRIKEDDLEPDTFERLLTLTPRELEVAKLMVEGWKPAKISKQLFISKSTVNIHRNKVYKKMGVSSATELIVMLADPTY